MVKYHSPVDPDRTRFAICRRCRCRMVDCETSIAEGEFWHFGGDPGCKNHGKKFRLGDSEIEPFVRKRVRRAAKRLGVRVLKD